jgi:hypothetical protein
MTREQTLQAQAGDRLRDAAEAVVNCGHLSRNATALARLQVAIRDYDAATGETTDAMAEARIRGSVR